MGEEEEIESSSDNGDPFKNCKAIIDESEDEEKEEEEEESEQSKEDKRQTSGEADLNERNAESKLDMKNTIPTEASRIIVAPLSLKNQQLNK